MQVFSSVLWRWGGGERDYQEINIYLQQQQQQIQKVGILDKDKQPTSKVRQACD